MVFSQYSANQALHIEEIMDEDRAKGIARIRLVKLVFRLIYHAEDKRRSMFFKWLTSINS